jgi:hypothetical protein
MLQIDRLIDMDSIMKPTKHCVKRGKQEWRNGNIIEGYILSHIWDYHHESPHIINV